MLKVYILVFFSKYHLLTFEDPILIGSITNKEL